MHRPTCTDKAMDHEHVHSFTCTNKAFDHGYVHSFTRVAALADLTVCAVATRYDMTDKGKMKPCQCHKHCTMTAQYWDGVQQFLTKTNLTLLWGLSPESPDNANSLIYHSAHQGYTQIAGYGWVSLSPPPTPPLHPSFATPPALLLSESLCEYPLSNVLSVQVGQRTDG